MKNAVQRLAIFTALALILAACGGGGGGGGSSVSTSTTNQLWEIHLDSGGGIHTMFYRGANITQGFGNYRKGGHYIIASCPKGGQGIDDQDNIMSQSFSPAGLLNIGDTKGFGGVLRGTTSFCKGARYSVTYERKSELVIIATLTLGPLPQEYASASVPGDWTKGLFNTYNFSTPQHQISTSGCGATTTVNKSGGTYGSIPATCGTPGGSVGIAQATGAVWVEACSSQLKACLRRTRISGNVQAALVFNHWGTNNTEWSWGIFIPANSYLTLVERIEIVPQP